MECTRVLGGIAATFARLVTETGAESLGAVMKRMSDKDMTVPAVVYDPIPRPPPRPRTWPGRCGLSGPAGRPPPGAARSCATPWASSPGHTGSPPGSPTTT
ncbi:hypothetical protein SVIO_024500 [Streptomyces violaceusniger]|uniref:Uncharacterized protein n=1 Tax=Streptomyces violaceusniger TaxID=68280 RepID=A0A4D4KZ92_STRVO|nr:hypothetical protein SVIO_024500 [Streptomyces violaceusniger]